MDEKPSNAKMPNKHHSSERARSLAQHHEQANTPALWKKGTRRVKITCELFHLIVHTKNIKMHMKCPSDLYLSNAGQ